VAGPYHQILGEGCVYPAAVPTLGNQLSACSHPAAWSADRTRHAERGDQYAARHDGFAFFQSVTANPAFCAAHILFSLLLAPNLRNGGHDAPRADGAPGGLAQADSHLTRAQRHADRPILHACSCHRYRPKTSPERRLSEALPQIACVTRASASYTCRRGAFRLRREIEKRQRQGDLRGLRRIHHYG
jgi:hypothetical protein